MKSKLSLLIVLFSSFSASAWELSCGYAETYERFPQRFHVVRASAVDGKISLTTQYKDLIRFNLQYSLAEEVLTSESKLIEHNLSHVNTFHFPLLANTRYTAGIYDPEVAEVALHCWLEKTEE